MDDSVGAGGGEKTLFSPLNRILLCQIHASSKKSSTDPWLTFPEYVVPLAGLQCLYNTDFHLKGEALCCS